VFGITCGVCLIETEIKGKVKNFAYIRDRLVHLQFKKVRSVREVDIYYNHPIRDFGQTGEVLRIRKSNTNALTYKGHVLSQRTKTRHEYQSGVSNADAMSKVLQSLGFKPCGIITKSREIWEYNGINANLDDVSSLGRFVEVEIMSSDHQNTADAEKQLFTVAEQIGLDIKSITTKSYLELIQEKFRNDVSDVLPIRPEKLQMLCKECSKQNHALEFI